MLSKVEVRNRRGETLSLPFEDFDNGLGVALIEGLDPVKATLVSSGFAGQDGEQYYYSKREKRNIKMKIELIPDFKETSARSLRQRLYKFLMPKTEVTLRFTEELGSYTEINGRVESLDAPLFTQDPMADVSLICFDSDFVDPTPVTISGVTVLGSNQAAITNIPYLGSVEAGFLFTMNPDRPLSSFSINHQTPSGSAYKLDFSETLLAGDKLIISTIAGSKGASLTRQGTVSSILWGVSPQARWLELEGPGDNQIRVSSSVAGVPWNIQYVNRHGGL